MRPSFHDLGCVIASQLQNIGNIAFGLIAFGKLRLENCFLVICFWKIVFGKLLLVICFWIIAFRAPGTRDEANQKKQYAQLPVRYRTHMTCAVDKFSIFAPKGLFV